MEKTSFLKEPVGGQSVVNKIVDNITNAIINGELNPGDKIPTEAELSESMGAGRNSVREAIKVLEAYGVVHIKRAEGTFVSQEYDSRMIYPVLYGIIPVSYTHLDVYKRQLCDRGGAEAFKSGDKPGLVAAKG